MYNACTSSNVTIDTLYSKHKELILKIRIEDGSLKAYLENIESILKYISSIGDGMDGKDKKHTYIAFFTIATLGLCVYSGATSYFNSQVEIAKNSVELNKYQVELARITADKEIKIKDEETKQMLMEVISEGQKYTAQIASNFSDFSKYMEKSDKISIGEHIYGKKEIKDAFKLEKEDASDTDSQFHTHYIDGKYDITKVNLKSRSITIEKDGTERTVSTAYLNESDIKRLHKKYIACQIVNTYPKKVDLRINLVVQHGRWKEAHVQGLGKARPAATAMQKALELPQEKNKIRQGLLLEQ